MSPDSQPQRTDGAASLPALPAALNPANYAKFCSKTTVGKGNTSTGSIIYMGHAANTMEHFKFASDLARQDFPDLRDSDIRTIQLASEMGMGNRVAGSYWGIEFEIGDLKSAPEEYERRENAWALKAG